LGVKKEETWKRLDYPFKKENKGGTAVRHGRPQGTRGQGRINTNEPRTKRATPRTQQLREKRQLETVPVTITRCGGGSSGDRSGNRRIEQPHNGTKDQPSPGKRLLRYIAWGKPASTQKASSLHRETLWRGERERGRRQFPRQSAPSRVGGPKERQGPRHGLRRKLLHQCPNRKNGGKEGTYPDDLRAWKGNDKDPDKKEGPGRGPEHLKVERRRKASTSK